MEDDPEHGDPTALEDDVASVPAKKPATLGSSFGTALGGAMLGLEQALRDQPPAEVIAGEHQPARGLSGDEDGLIIVFPDDEVEPTG